MKSHENELVKCVGTLVFSVYNSEICTLKLYITCPMSFSLTSRLLKKPTEEEHTDSERWRSYHRMPAARVPQSFVLLEERQWLPERQQEVRVSRLVTNERCEMSHLHSCCPQSFWVCLQAIHTGRFLACTVIVFNLLLHLCYNTQ